MRIIRTIIDTITDGTIRLFSGSGEVGEIIEGGEFIQQIGFASRPKSGQGGLIIEHGNRTYLIATDYDTRPSLDENERVFYYDANNYVKFEISSGILSRIYVKTEKAIDLEATGEVNITGSKAITNAITELAKGLGVLYALVTYLFVTAVYNVHTHQESGGGTTLPPNQLGTVAHATVNTTAS